MQPMSRAGLGLLMLSMALALPGCDKKPATPAAAVKVNGAAISVALLDHEVGKLGQILPEQRQTAAGQVLKTLVDQELLMQKAVADKLDQEPAVQTALESARRQILSQVYVERLVAAAAKPTDQEVADYFAKHPQLFSERRIYRLQEISVRVAPGNAEGVKARLGDTRSLDEFVQWLKQQQIPVQVSQTSKAAEQLPAELLPRLAQLQDGQAMTVSSPDTLNILVRAGSQLQAVTLAQAKGDIARYLGNSRKREIAMQTLKDLHGQAKVEYLGDYAGLAPRDAAVPPPAAGKASAPQ